MIADVMSGSVGERSLEDLEAKGQRSSKPRLGVDVDT